MDTSCDEYQGEFERDVGRKCIRPSGEEDRKGIRSLYKVCTMLNLSSECIFTCIWHPRLHGEIVLLYKTGIIVRYEYILIFLRILVATKLSDTTSNYAHYEIVTQEHKYNIVTSSLLQS